MFRVIYSPFTLMLDVDSQPTISFDLTTAFVAPVRGDEVKRCYNTLTIFQKRERTLPSGETTTHVSSQFPLETLCNLTNITRMAGFYAPATLISEEENKIILLDTILDSYYFPYDLYEVDIELEVEAEIHETSTVKSYILEPDLYYDVDARDWEIEIIDNGQPEFERNRLHFRLHRPYFQRATTTVILALILALILLLPTLQERGSALEVTAAILFSLWGVQSILIPSYVNWTTFVSQLILVLYILLAVALFMRFSIVPLWKWLNKVPMDEQGVSHSNDSEEILANPGQESVTTLETRTTLLQASSQANLIMAVAAMIASSVALIMLFRKK